MPHPPHPPHGDTLEALARRAAYLSASHRDPEVFHVSKSEIVADLRRLARTLGKTARCI